MLCEGGSTWVLTLMYQGLNPCYSGICSVSPGKYEYLKHEDGVLILVIVEYAL